MTTLMTDPMTEPMADPMIDTMTVFMTDQNCDVSFALNIHATYWADIFVVLHGRGHSVRRHPTMKPL